MCLMDILRALQGSKDSSNKRSEDSKYHESPDIEKQQKKQSDTELHSKRMHSDSNQENLSTKKLTSLKNQKQQHSTQSQSQNPRNNPQQKYSSNHNRNEVQSNRNRASQRKQDDEDTNSRISQSDEKKGKQTGKNQSTQKKVLKNQQKFRDEYFERMIQNKEGKILENTNAYPAEGKIVNKLKPLEYKSYTDQYKERQNEERLNANVLKKQSKSQQQIDQIKFRLLREKSQIASPQRFLQQTRKNCPITTDRNLRSNFQTIQQQKQKKLSENQREEGEIDQKRIYMFRKQSYRHPLKKSLMNSKAEKYSSRTQSKNGKDSENGQENSRIQRKSRSDFENSKRRNQSCSSRRDFENIRANWQTDSERDWVGQPKPKPVLQKSQSSQNQEHTQEQQKVNCSKNIRDRYRLPSERQCNVRRLVPGAGKCVMDAGREAMFDGREAVYVGKHVMKTGKDEKDNEKKTRHVGKEAKYVGKEAVYAGKCVIDTGKEAGDVKKEASGTQYEAERFRRIEQEAVHSKRKQICSERGAIYAGQNQIGSQEEATNSGEQAVVKVNTSVQYCDEKIKSNMKTMENQTDVELETDLSTLKPQKAVLNNLRLDDVISTAIELGLVQVKEIKEISENGNAHKKSYVENVIQNLDEKTVHEHWKQQQQAYDQQTKLKQDVKGELEEGTIKQIAQETEETQETVLQKEVVVCKEPPSLSSAIDNGNSTSETDMGNWEGENLSELMISESLGDTEIHSSKEQTKYEEYSRDSSSEVSAVDADGGNFFDGNENINLNRRVAAQEVELKHHNILKKEQQDILKERQPMRAPSARQQQDLSTVGRQWQASQPGKQSQQANAELLSREEMQQDYSDTKNWTPEMSGMEGDKLADRPTEAKCLAGQHIPNAEKMLENNGKRTSSNSTDLNQKKNESECLAESNQRIPSFRGDLQIDDRGVGEEDVSSEDSSNCVDYNLQKNDATYLAGSDQDHRIEEETLEKETSGCADRIDHFTESKIIDLECTDRQKNVQRITAKGSSDALLSDENMEQDVEEQQDAEIKEQDEIDIECRAVKMFSQRTTYEELSFEEIEEHTPKHQQNSDNSSAELVFQDCQVNISEFERDICERNSNDSKSQHNESPELAEKQRMFGQNTENLLVGLSQRTKNEARNTELDGVQLLVDNSMSVMETFQSLVSSGGENWTRATSLTNTSKQQTKSAVCLKEGDNLSRKGVGRSNHVRDPQITEEARPQKDGDRMIKYENHLMKDNSRQGERQSGGFDVKFACSQQNENSSSANVQEGDIFALDDSDSASAITQGDL